MESYNRLLEHNIKPSMQRIAIMNYLMEHKTHPAGVAVHDLAGAFVPARNAATVGAGVYGAFADHYGRSAGRAGSSAAYPYDSA